MAPTDGVRRHESVSAALRERCEAAFSECEVRIETAVWWGRHLVRNQCCVSVESLVCALLPEDTSGKLRGMERSHHDNHVADRPRNIKREEVGSRLCSSDTNRP